ncbi:MAG: hypothetical protein WCY89_06160 [Flavobacteriaceae bacterium]
MRFFLKTLIFIVLFLAIGCNNPNTRNISIKGKIIDKDNFSPIINAKITALCWYDVGWDKRDYESIDIISQNDGSFEVNFTEGYRVVIASIATQYYYSIKKIDNINSSDIEVEIYMERDSMQRDINKIDLKDIILKHADW